MSNKTREFIKCEDCIYWMRDRREIVENGKNYGECLNKTTLAYVRGDNFEPPEDFGCVNGTGE